MNDYERAKMFARRALVAGQDTPPERENIDEGVPLIDTGEMGRPSPLRTMVQVNHRLVLRALQIVIVVLVHRNNLLHCSRAATKGEQPSWTDKTEARLDTNSLQRSGDCSL